MLRPLTSGNVTFVDLSDNRKLQAYIASNLPTTQIYNQNTNPKKYTPDWSTTNLQLSADIYLDSKEVTTNTYTSIVWSQRVGTQTKTQIGTGTSLTINSNQLSSDVGIITYICEATYKDTETNPPTAYAEITFTRVDTGLNGSDGNDAPAVLAQYSTDGTTGWTSTLNTTTHKYIRHSYDDGTTWSAALKIVGDDGTSVRIKGTATSATQVSGTDYYTLVYSSASLTNAELGDAYLYDGDLYVCADSRDGQDYFINVGNIQGPKGGDGKSSYVFIRYATDTNGTNMSTSPTGKTYMGVYTSDTNVAPTTASVYTWSKFVGDNAKSIVLSGESQVFKVNQSNVITPSTIKVTAQAFNTTITAWTYSTNGGQTFLSTVPTGVSRNGNIVTITGSTITSNSIVIKASDGQVEDVFTVYKAIDGSDGTPGTPGSPAPIAFLTNENVTFSANAQGQISGTTITSNVVAYEGTTKVTPILRKNADGTPAITGMPSGMSIAASEITASNEIMLTITIANNSTLGSVSNNMGIISIPVTYPVSTVLSLTWSKVNAGTPGATGPAGSDAYTVMLTNESHIFAGDVSNALAGLTTTQVVAYKGATSQSVTITSVNGVPASTTDIDTGIVGLKFKCSALSGTSPTITFTCTTAFKSASGSIPIILSVGGISFTKMFTYSIAFKGLTGATGPTGQTGAAASIVDITPSAHYFKSTTGKDGTFTPEFIYLYPRFQNVTYSNWQYSLNGGTTWTAVTNANGLSVGTYSSVGNALRVSRTSALYTDTVTSISFRCNSLTSGVYDTVSIAKIYDVVDLNIGGRNYILNSENLSVSGLGSSNGSRMEYKYIDVGQSYMNIPSGTEVAISFDLEMTVNTANPTLLVYNTNRKGPKTITSKTLYFNAAVGTTIKQRCSVITTITDVKDATLTTNSLEFYSTYETYNWFKISNLKLEIGNKATSDWSPAPEDLKSTTFQLYAPKGYLITHDVPEVTLQTFAYDGSQPITNATFKWYSWSGENWTVINNATSTSLTVNKNNVLKSNVYKCEMTYSGKVYEATATVEDKTDIYESLIRVNAKRTSNNGMYWILYATVYSEEGERDALLGPVSETAPISPTTGEYWYQINPTNYSITLKKYSGTAWVTSTDKQELSYDWFLFRDTTEMVSLGDKSKIKIVKSGDFVTTCNVQCNVFDAENTVLSRNNQVLNDPTDPIISDTAPTNPIDGQIWIKVGANGSYMLSVWSAELSKWILSNADTQNKVYVTKPTQYNAGDLWIVDSNYSPVAYENGVMKDYKHPEKTMLMATATSQTYSDAHWVEALKYQKELDGVIKDMEDFKQFISIDDTGLTMQAKGANGAVSEFKTMLTNTELGFYQGAARVAYINNNQLNISKAEITNGLVVSGTTPTLKIGNFTIIQESNGSLSIG